MAGSDDDRTGQGDLPVTGPGTNRSMHGEALSRLINDAMSQSLAKYGPLTGDPVRAALIISSECGEVSEATLNATKPYAPSRDIGKQAQADTNTYTEIIRRAHLLAELAQLVQLAEQLMVHTLDHPDSVEIIILASKEIRQ